MEKKEYRLEEGTNNIRVNVASSDVRVYAENIKTPIVQYKGEIEIDNRNNNAVILEKSNNNNGIINSFNGNNGSIVISGSGVININGCIGSGNVIINGSNYSSGGNYSINNDPTEVTLYYPANLNDIKLDIKGVSSDIEVNDLYLLKLIVSTISGDITLENINSIYTYLKTKSGDIEATILESMLNYNVYMSTKSGDTISTSQEKTAPIFLNQKNIIEAETKSGDIKILFKGRR